MGPQMRKTVIATPTSLATFPETNLWLDLAAIADVEVSSEDPAWPFESCLGLEGSGWKASSPGPQIIRLLFPKPQKIRLIHVEFSELLVERTQEFWVMAHFAEVSREELIRQQWSFSPGGSTSEIEDFTVLRERVSTLELHIDPGRHDKQRFATLKYIALA